MMTGAYLVMEAIFKAPVFICTLYIFYCTHKNILFLYGNINAVIILFKSCGHKKSDAKSVERRLKIWTLILATSASKPPYRL
jgi:hypothetical protein